MGNCSFHALKVSYEWLYRARYGVQLEKGPFHTRTADFLWMMIFGSFSLLVCEIISIIFQLCDLVTNSKLSVKLRGDSSCSGVLIGLAQNHERWKSFRREIQYAPQHLIWVKLSYVIKKEKKSFRREMGKIKNKKNEKIREKEKKGRGESIAHCFLLSPNPHPHLSPLSLLVPICDWVYGIMLCRHLSLLLNAYANISVFFSYISSLLCFRYYQQSLYFGPPS